MGHIFISYSHHDKAYAHKLQRYLLEHGFDSWVDDRIDYGVRWPREIEKRLKDCEAFILVMSPNSHDSDWVQNELNYARQLKKPIFPLLLAGEAWWHVGTMQYVDVQGGKLPPAKFITRLAETAPRISETDNLATPTPAEKPREAISVHVQGDVKAPVIIGNDNKVQNPVSRAWIKKPAEAKPPASKAPVEPEKPAPQENMASQPAPKPGTRERKPLKTEVIIAIIGLVGTLGAALIAALPWKEWFPANPAPTTTATFTAPPPTFTATFTPNIPTRTPAPTLTPTKVITPTATPLRDEITDARGVTMRLVPAGPFTMGSEDYDDEQPPHQVYLDVFYMDKYEVTNALYKACMDAGGCSAPGRSASFTRSSYYGNAQYDNFPVIYVNWNQAKTYCEWRGARLPSEAEWEKAARGTDGRTYPWGEGIGCSKANYYGCKGDTTQAGSYESGKSPYGIYDMAGNVWEWVDAWYDAYPGNTSSNSDYGTRYRVLRGGSWYSSGNVVRSANRNRDNPTDADDDIGFRCSRSP